MLKNITFSAEESAIARAREEARSKGTTLNELVREFIEDLGRPKVDLAAYHAAIEAMRAETRGKVFRMPTREEMNARR